MAPLFRHRFGLNGIHRRSVFLKLLVSNAVILLVPLLIVIILYVRVELFITENAQQYNLAMLQQLQKEMDWRIKEVEQFSVQIALNPKLNPLLGESSASGDNGYKFWEFNRNYLERTKLMTSDFIYDYYLYFAGTDTVLKPGLVTDSRTFYQYYYNYAGKSYQDWRDTILTAVNNRTFIAASELVSKPSVPPNPYGKPSGKPSGNVISYVQSLPLGALADVKGALVVMIDESKIRDMIQQIESVNQSSVFIVNSKDELVMGTDKPLDREFFTDYPISAPKGLFDARLHGKDVMVSYTTSEQTDWKYVTIMPTGLFLARVNMMQMAAIWLFLFFLVAGSAAAYFIAYRNYAPLKLMLQAVRKGKPADRSSRPNEYELLQETIEESLTEGRNLREIVQRQMPVVRSNFLSRLIRGHVELSDDMETSEWLDLRFESDRFAVMLIDIDDAAAFAAELNEKQWASIRFILTNVATELVQQYHFAYSVELDRDRLALLVNLNPIRMETGLEDLVELSIRLKDWIETKYQLVITISISDIHHGSAMIGTCYKEAMEAADCRMVRGRGELLLYRDLKHTETGFDYTIETETLLMNMVKSGDAEEAERILEQIYETNFQSKRISPEIGRCLFFNMAGTLLKILNASPLRNTEEMDRLFDSIKHVFAASTAECMHERTKRLFRLLTDAIREERTDHGQQTLEKMTGLVLQHLTDPDLGLALIAKQMNMSPQYLSTFFKKSFGENLTDYILRKRIDYAKKLMEDKSLTNHQIAQMVGYSNDLVFIRAFKKLEGVTPGKYRECK
ncbi:AraC family transcriptional regulator [Paenibacillus gansuensis]|uniref:AraC family transcriptional regulator n=1 Tax=Paenibacillus gansuensis TaxID=306542 RepID=A0ABW5PGP7_9BACL